MARNILQTESLSLSVGEKILLSNLSFSLPHPGLVVLLGENGMGKSTLLREIYLHAKTKPDWQWPLGLQKISYLGHELGMYSSLSLKENLDFFSGDGGKPISWLNEMVQSFGLQQRVWDPIYTYSRGMKQKAAILRALAPSSALVLLDEPFTGLDQSSLRKVITLFHTESQTRTLMMVLHEIPYDLKPNLILRLEKGGIHVEPPST